MNPRPKPQPKPKPANLMEEVISIKHDESVVENPCLHTVAREWAARLDVSPMAASQMIVAFWQLPARPYKPQERPLPERVSLAEEALSSDPMQAWFRIARGLRVQPDRCSKEAGSLPMADPRGPVARPAQPDSH